MLRLPEIDSALQVLSEILQQLTNQKSSIEEDIHAAFDELQKTLNVRKSVLLMELEVNYGLKQKVRADLELRPAYGLPRSKRGSTCGQSMRDRQRSVEGEKRREGP